jgi:hypothetical protein
MANTTSSSWRSQLKGREAPPRRGPRDARAGIEGRPVGRAVDRSTRCPAYGRVARTLSQLLARLQYNPLSMATAELPHSTAQAMGHGQGPMAGAGAGAGAAAAAAAAGDTLTLSRSHSTHHSPLTSFLLPPAACLPQSNYAACVLRTELQVFASTSRCHFHIPNPPPEAPPS